MKCNEFYNVFCCLLSAVNALAVNFLVYTVGIEWLNKSQQTIPLFRESHCPYIKFDSLLLTRYAPVILLLEIVVVVIVCFYYLLKCCTPCFHSFYKSAILCKYTFSSIWSYDDKCPSYGSSLKSREISKEFR